MVIGSTELFIVPLNEMQFHKLHVRENLLLDSVIDGVVVIVELDSIVFSVIREVVVTDSGVVVITASAVVVVTDSEMVVITDSAVVVFTDSGVVVVVI